MPSLESNSLGFWGLCHRTDGLRGVHKKQSLGFARHFRDTYPDFLQGAPPTSACAAFIKESRKKLAKASKLDRKSGVRWGERGAPVRFPSGPIRSAKAQTLTVGSRGKRSR